MSNRGIVKDSCSDDYSFMERAVGSIIGCVIYNQFKDELRNAEMRVRIRRHVRMAEAVKEEVRSE